MKKPIRVLVVEDSEDDAILEVNELKKGGYDPTYERVETPEAIREALENKKWDCIISDYSMPKFSGLDALHELQKSGIDIPFILVSGTVGEDVAVAAMKTGAHDYIMKGDLTRLIPAIERELRETQIRRERKKAEEKINLLAHSLKSINECVSITDLTDTFLFVNDAFLKTYGFAEHELIGKNVNIVRSTRNQPGVIQEILPATMSGGWSGELWNRRKDGSEFPISLSTSLVRDNQGQAIALIGVTEDITKRKQAEGALRQAEEKYRNIFDNAVIGIYQTTIDGQFLIANPTLSHLLGYESPQELTTQLTDCGHHFYVEADRRAEFIRLIQEQDTVADFESQIFRKDGKVIWISENSRALRDADGALIGFEGTAIDITNRKQAEEERELLTAVFEATTDFVGIADANMHPLYLNSAGRRMVGIGSDEDISSIDFSKYHTDWARRLVYEEGIPTAVREGTWAGEAEFLARGGHTIPISQIIITHKSRGGKVEYISTVARDITDRKRAETLLREERDMLNAIMETSVAAVTVVDQDGNIIFANTRAEEILGLEKSSITALKYNAPEWKITDFDGKPFPEDQLPFRRVMTSNAPVFDIEHAIEWPNGERRLLSINGAPLRDDAGKITRVVFAVDDITEKKKLEERNLRAQRMESIGTLAGGIAHDLNNVLAPIMMALEMLQQKFTDDKSLKILDTLHSSVKRGADLVKQVLSFARGVEGERVPIQVRHLISEVEKIIGETFPKSISAVTKVPKDLWLVSADSTQIHQVLMNLCVNARDAMPRGGKIEIEASNVVLDETYARMHPDAKLGPYVALSITDNGTGMPPAVTNRIFEPFFTTKEIGKGTGLGLSTVLAVVKSHQGFVNVYSELNKGTTFKVYIPAQLSGEIMEPEKGEAALPSGNGELVLVVDDEAAIREITKSTLELHGYEVVTANDGTEAITQYAEKGEQIAVVLTDMMMPFMDGAATIRALRKMNPAVKIIAVTGLADNGFTAASTAGGNIKILQKPYTAQTVLKTIKDILGT